MRQFIVDDYSIGDAPWKSGVQISAPALFILKSTFLSFE